MKPNELDVMTYSMVDLFEQDDHTMSEVFHEYTKLNRQTIAPLASRVNHIMNDPGLVRMMARAWKTYAGAERVALPAPALGTMTVEEAIRRRRSVSSDAGTFKGGPITLTQLSSVLAYSYGGTRALESEKFPGERLYLRATTSAGGLYPLEIYPIVFNVDGLEEGIYHYRMVDHSLDVLSRDPVKSRFLDATTYYDLANTSSVVLAVSALFARTLTKYLHRGYRFLLHDVGALLQSFYMTGTALGLGTCALGGFYDDDVGSLIGLNNVDEAVVMCFLLGEYLPPSGPRPPVRPAPPRTSV